MRRPYNPLVAEERHPDPATPADLLDEWRDAEREVKGETPGSPDWKMARKRVRHARDDFHDAEDAERENQGDDRARKQGHGGPKDVGSS